MKRFAKVLACLALAAFLLGLAAPAAYAETRRIDVTVAAADVNIFSYAYYFDNHKMQVDYLKKIKVEVLVGGSKVKEAVLDNYYFSRDLVLTTEKQGDIKIRLDFDWRDNFGPSRKEYAYTGPGQKIVLECAGIEQVLPNFKYKQLMDPYTK
jgi:hypothetical protein